MKIIELQAENIKKIRAVSIRPDGALVQITGPNGQGKTSVLDSIYWALAGTKEIDSVPVRAGEAKAIIKLDLGEVIVTRRFTSNGGTSLEVAAANGAKFPSPQKMLDDLLGTLTFDPLAFTRQTPKQQLETLRGMVKLELNIDSIDAEVKTAFDMRAGINREIKQFQAQADAINVSPDTPAEEISVGALVAQLDAAGKANTELETRKARRASAAADIQYKLSAAKTKRDEAAARLKAAEDLEKEAADLQAKLDGAEALPEPIDTAPISKQIYDAKGINDRVAEKKKLLHLLEVLKLRQQAADSLTNKMETLTAAKAKAISEADMPVIGLAFGTEEVLYNGLPLAQASSAEQLRVSVAIAMAANPKLRVLRIKDGSLLDETSLQMLGDTAELNDFQVWIERVDTSGSVGIIMEDGNARVAGASTDVPLPETEAAQ